MTANDRLAVCLDTLSREELIELAALGCAASKKVARHADAKIAKHLPSWCLEQVLLSPDLLPTLFGSVNPGDWQAAAACSAWRAAWNALLRPQRYLQPSRVLPIPLDPRSDHIICAITVINGVICVGGYVGGDSAQLRFFSQQGEPRTGGAWHAMTQATFRFASCMHVHEDALLVADEHARCLRRLRRSDGIELARWDADPDSWVDEYNPGPREFALDKGLLYVPAEDRVLVLDAYTLELHHEIAHHDDAEAVCCAVWNDELYVGDIGQYDTLYVYGLQEGDLRRKISGTFGAPYAVRIHQGLIYLVEEPDVNDDKKGTGVGKQLVVLNLDGNTHQVVQCEAERFYSLCVHEDEVLLLNRNHTAHRHHIHVLSPPPA